MASNFLVEIRSQNLFTEFQDNAKFRCWETPQLYLDPFRDVDHVQPMDRDATPAPVFRPPPFLRVSLSQRPKNFTSGWVVGSDPTACDIVIGVSEPGISRKQFTIHPQKDVGRVIVQNLSRNGTHVQERKGDKTTLTLVMSQRGLNEGQLMKMILGKIELEIITAVERSDTYKKQWAKMYAEQQNEGLAMNTLTLKAGAPSTRLCKYALQNVVIDHADYMVFTATERSTRKKVILKRYVRHKVRSAEHEVKLLRSIQHEHIANLQDYTAPDLILTFFPGQTLDVEHNEHPITFGEFKGVVHQLLGALAYVHGLGKFHGQLSPPNIVLTKRRPSVKAMLLNFSVEPICKPKLDMIDQDMEDFMHLCSLFLGTGHFNAPFFFNSNAREILLTIRSARRKGPPTEEASSLLNDRGFLIDLATRSEDDDSVLPPIPSAHGRDISNCHSDEVSLPDTELPANWKEDIDVFVHAKGHKNGRRKISIKKDGLKYELNLTELIRASQLTPWHGAKLRKSQSSNCRKEGRGSRVAYWMPLSKAICLTSELNFTELHDQLLSLMKEHGIDVSHDYQDAADHAREMDTP